MLRMEIRLLQEIFFLNMFIDRTSHRINNRHPTTCVLTKNNVMIIYRTIIEVDSFDIGSDVPMRELQ